MLFNPNDVVRVIARDDTMPAMIHKGMIGIIKNIVNIHNQIGVQFAKSIRGTDLSGSGLPGHCWYFPSKFLERYEFPKLFLPNDRIVVIAPSESAWFGISGTIRSYSNNNMAFAVEIDESHLFPGIRTHSCDGEIPLKRGVWLSFGEFYKEVDLNVIVYPVMKDYITIVF